MKRNITLDYYKIFLSILVICIHFSVKVSYSGFVDGFYEAFIKDGITRIAVPSFFLINGYFLKIESFSSVKKYILHIGIIYLVWSLFYLPNFNIYNVKSFSIILIFGYAHLWYLVALIEAVILFYFLKKILRKDIFLFVIAIGLFVIGYFVQIKYSELTPFSILKYRNFLFIGLPFIIIGNLIKNAKFHIKRNILIWILFPISFISFILEIYLSNKIYFDDITLLNTREIYLSLIFICPILLLLILNNSRYSDNIKELNQLSSAIYFIHIFVIHIVVKMFLPSLHVLPFVIILSVFFSIVIIQANKSVKIFL